MYRSIVFDVDGVLLTRHPDNPAVYRQPVAETFREFGTEPSRTDLDAFVGSATVDGMQRVCDAHGVQFEEFWPRREHHVSTLQQHMMAQGERTLYDDCSVLAELSVTYDLGIVSNNQHTTIEQMVEQFELGAHFATSYGREPTVDGFRQMKPETHYLERALEDLGTRAALYVGDSTCDVVAAREAGLDSAFLWRSHRDGYDLGADPTYEIESLSELVGIVDG